MTNKRLRGRPKGTAINDAKYLNEVATLMVRDPELKKTPTISRIVQKYFQEHRWQSVERRLLRKWNETGAERIEEAKLQYAEEQASNNKTTTKIVTRSPAELGNAYRLMEQTHQIGKMMDRIANPPALRAVMEQQKRIQDAIDPPALRLFREQNDAIKRAMRPFKFM